MNYPTRELIEYCNNRPDVETENIETVDGIIYKSKLNITKQISHVLLAMHDEIDRLTKLVQVPVDFCEWHEDKDGWWDTSCDQYMGVSADTPSQNHYNFCPSCGRKLIEISWTCDDTDE